MRTSRRARVLSGLLSLGLVAATLGATTATSAADPSAVPASALLAVNASKGVLSGRVVDDAGHGAAGVPVTLTRSTAAGTVTVATPTTDSNGLVFASTSVPASGATYRLLAGTDVVAQASVAGPAPTPVASSTTGSNKSIPLSGYRDMEVDDLHGRVYVSTGSDIQVFDLDGNAVGSITPLGGPGQLALSADDTTLFVGLDNAGYIAVVDTATLQVVGNLHLPPGSDGGDGFYGLEVVGSKVAAGLNRSGQWGGAVAIVPVGDPASGSLMTGVFPGRLAASTARMEVASFSGTSGIITSFWDVSGATPVAVAEPSSAISSSDNPGDFDYSNDGRSIFFTPSGTPYQAQRVSMTTGEVSTSYETGPYPASIAETRDNASVATSRFSYGQALSTFDAATGTPIRELPSGSDNTWSDYAAGDSLAFSADGNRLYAIQSFFTDPIRFEVWTDPLVACSASITSATVSNGQVHVAAQVTSQGAPMGGTVTVSVPGRTGAIGSAAIPSSGTVTVDATLPSGSPVGSVQVSAQLPVGRPCTATAALPKRVPSKPPLVVALGGTSAIAVFWQAPADPGSSALLGQTIVLYKGALVVGRINMAPDAWIAGITGLAPGTYRVAVVARNAVGLGPQSTPVTVVVGGT